jgi:opine dehydrogenase
MTQFAVLGAGSAGQGLASFLALRGYDVALYNPPVHADRFEPIARTKSVSVSGVLTGVARFSVATCDIGNALAGADVVFLTLRSFAHRDVLTACLEHLKPGQLLVVVTGYWVTLRLRELLAQLDPRILVAETTLLPLASEAIGPGAVKITGIKSRVKIAAFPAEGTPEVVERLHEALPQIVAGNTVLDTNLDNFNPVVHSPIALLNLGELERNPRFEFYRQGTTPKVAAVMDSMDAERLALASAVGLTENVRFYYGATGRTTVEVFQNCQAYAGYVLPNVFDYIREDVPYGLVPLASLGESVGIPCPALRSVIAGWSTVDDVDYWKEGMTATRLGLDGLSASQVMEYAQTGRLPDKKKGVRQGHAPR